MQHLRALKVAKKLKREALAKEEEEEEYLLKELVARVDVIEEESEEGSDEDSEDEEDREINDSEEQGPSQANVPALDTLIASSQNHGAFDNTTFVYQRGPEPSKKHSSEDPSGSELIIIIIVHLRMQPEGYGAAIYIFWAPGPYRTFVSPVSSLAVLRGPPLLSLDFCFHSAL